MEIESYNLDFLEKLNEEINVPIIIMGGVGEWKHMVEGIKHGAQSVAAGNIFHFTEHSTKKAKDFIIKSGIKMRPPYFYSINSSKFSRKIRDIHNPGDEK